MRCLLGKTVVEDLTGLGEMFGNDVPAYVSGVLAVEQTLATLPPAGNLAHQRLGCRLEEVCEKLDITSKYSSNRGKRLG